MQRKSCFKWPPFYEFNLCPPLHYDSFLLRYLQISILPFPNRQENSHLLSLYLCVDWSFCYKTIIIIIIIKQSKPPTCLLLLYFYMCANKIYCFDTRRIHLRTRARVRSIFSFSRWLLTSKGTHTHTNITLRIEWITGQKYE